MPGQEDIEVTCEVLAGLFIKKCFIVQFFLYTYLYVLVLPARTK